MRTVNDVIKYVNDIKPNAFTDDTLTEWLSECEGSIQTEILCIASGDVVTYSYADNKDTELIVKPPHDKLYGFYLLAMIDFAHGEYKKYENTMQLFNAALSEFAKWFVRTHSKEAKNPEGYYMSGYDLAVKHGYSGTEEEWLKTLIGPQGVQGIQGEKGDRGIPGKIQSVTSGDNGKILVDGESVVVYDDSEIKEELGGKVDKAIGKGLSSNDYTDDEKNKLANLSNYDDTEIKKEVGGKVDKVQGKGLSSNDYTAEEKTKLSDLPDKQGLDTLFELENNKINAIQALATQLNISKVDKEDGKGLSANDFTNEDKETLNNSASYSDFQSLSTEVHTLYKELKENKEDLANKVTTLDSNSTDTQYPSAKTVYDELVKKSDKTTITTSTETTANIALADNTEFIFTEELEELEISLPQNATEPYICSVVFNSGETPTGVVYTTGSIYFKGINCTGSTFTPTANKHYTLMFVYDSMELICYVSAKPINEIILFSTADTDEASVMSDESTAEESESVMETSESVAEEPESEPNEVI